MLPSIVLMGGSMTAGAGARNTPGHGYLLAADADREQVIDALKVAFAGGRLTKDKFDAGVGRALTSRTYAELAAIIADIPAGPARTQWRSQDPAAPATPRVPARRITHSSSIVRTVRVRQWPRVLLAGVVLVILGLTLLSSEPRSEMIFLGAMIILQAAARGVVRLPSDQDPGCRCVDCSASNRNAQAAT
jgi:Domain of unknown function (DUF1707)